MSPRHLEELLEAGLLGLALLIVLSPLLLLWAGFRALTRNDY